MTRDAQKQSVKRCEYSHRWTKAHNYDQYQLPLQSRIVCEICKANPKAKEVDAAGAQIDLRELLSAGDTIYTTIRHVSRSGMQRVIDLHIIKDNEPRWIGYMAAKAMGDRYDDRKQGIVIGGCGMDMGFALVYNLSSLLFRDGFGCVGKSADGGGQYCPSNDHSNGDRDYTPHMSTDERKGASGEPYNCHKEHWHQSGGYALRQRWM